MRAESDPEELREPVGLLDRLRARERGDRSGAARLEHRLRAVERLVPFERLEAPVPALDERILDPVRRVQMPEGEAALVAEPALVDLGMVTREDPLHLPLASRHADVAADRAEAADGRSVLDLPRPRLEAVLRRGQRADRAELDH